MVLLLFFSGTNNIAQRTTQDKACQRECESCCKIQDRATAADVVYRKTLVCVNCALTGLHFQDMPGYERKKIKVSEIRRQCMKCQGSQTDTSALAWWFCRKCQQHFCDKCKELDDHSCNGDKVG